MKLFIAMTNGDVNLVCEKAKIADGFLQIIAPQPQEQNNEVLHKEMLISTSQIKMIVVD